MFTRLTLLAVAALTAPAPASAADPFVPVVEAANKKLVKVFALGEAVKKDGYTRILKLGPRQGDNEPMVRIELV